MNIRRYTSADCAEMAELFYNTVHTINAKDYSKEQQYELLNLIRWDNDNCVSELEKAGWKVIRGK